MLFDGDTTSESSAHLVRMANERTFLSWIKVSLGIVALGFGVETVLSLENERQADYLGFVIVAVGALTGIVSVYRYYKTSKEIEAGKSFVSTRIAGIFLAFPMVIILGVLFIADILM